MSTVSPAPAAPVPAPAAPTPPADPTAHLDDTPAEAVNWESLNDGIAPGHDDGADVPDPTPATTPAPAAPAPAPVPAPAPAVPATPATGTPAPAAAPVAAPAAPPTEPVPTAPVAPAPPAKTQAEIDAEAQAARTAAITGLSTHYASEMSEEDARGLLTEPEKILPKLMAKAALDGMQMGAAMAQQFLATTVPQNIARQQANERAEQEFYTANPDLSDPKFKSVVEKCARTVFELNPKMAKEDRIKKVGEVARSMLGIIAPAPGAPAAAPAPAAAAPTQPAAPARPFTPAPGGGSPARPAATAEANVWDELAAPD